MKKILIIFAIITLICGINPRLPLMAGEKKVVTAPEPIWTTNPTDPKSKICNALTEYSLDNNRRWPTSEQGLLALFEKPEIEPIPENWKGPYLELEKVKPWIFDFRYLFPCGNPNLPNSENVYHKKDQERYFKGLKKSYGIKNLENVKKRITKLELDQSKKESGESKTGLVLKYVFPN